jgi:hypothetical protein
LVQDHETDPQCLEFCAKRREMVNAASQSIELDAGDCVEAPTPRIREKSIQLGPTVLGAADAMVGIDSDHFLAPCEGVFAQGRELRIRVLIKG